MRVFFISEIGINHNGDIEICKKLIDLSKESGCDAVKFQKRDINKVYTQNINNLGYIPNGVFWNSTNSQFSRFEFLVKLIKQNSEGILSNIADVGCGYGAFLNFLLLNKVKFKKYRGYDINPKLIQFCKRNYPNYLFFINHL